MLHRAWEDFTAWGGAWRNVVRYAHPPHVPRKGRKIWSVTQLRTFLDRARHDRFFALWVLEATSGMRRSELAGARIADLDFEAETLTLERTRVVLDGQVVESDGKTENAQRIVVLDPLTLTLLRSHVEMLSRERAEFGSGYVGSGLLFCWEDGRPVHPDTITSRFGKIVESAGLPNINLHDVRHSYASCRAGREDRLEDAQRADRTFRRSLHYAAVRADRPGGAPPGGDRPRRAHPRRRHGCAGLPCAEKGWPGCGWLNQGLVHKSVHTRERTSPGAAAPRL